MTCFVLLRDLCILFLGVWYFEFHLDYRLPAQNNLLLFFVAIPIIWATMMQLWTSISYKDQRTPVMYWACHILAILLLSSSVFLISAVLNTIRSTLDIPGIILFHGVGWTALFGIIFYDVMDIERMKVGDQG